MFSEISLVAWMSGAIVFAVGGGAGFYIARKIKDKHTLGLEKQLETTQNQLSEYQGEVNRHFLKTSLLFNKLTDDYREVYEHLATGAQKLCNDKPLATTLDLPKTKILGATLTAGVSTAIANGEEPSVDTAPPTLTDTQQNDMPQPDTEASITAEAITTPVSETAPPEDIELPEKVVEKSVEAEQSSEESPATEKVIAAVETTDNNTPTITEEELKALETQGQKKDEEDDVHLGAESAPSVTSEHHKTHPSIH